MAIAGYGIQVVNANIHMGMDVTGVVAGSNQINSHLGRTTEKTKRAINQFGYMYLALQRIATYTAIFSFFAGFIRLIGQVVQLQERQAEVATLVDMRNERLKQSYQSVIKAITKLPPHLGSAIDLTKGLYEIMSAGVNEPEEAMKLLVLSAKYAKAGLTDLATAASTATAVMKAYGLSADQMREKLDVMFGSVMEGKYHADELNDALGTVIPTAAAMGVSIEEVSMAMAVLTQRGLDVHQAATGLNRMLLAWMKPLDKSRREFHKLGLEFGRNAFASKTFGEQLAIIQEASKRYGDMLPNIFTRQRGLRAAFVLTGTGLDDYNRLMGKQTSLTEEGGEVNRAAIKIQETVADKLKATRNEILQTASSWMNFSGAATMGVDTMRMFTTGLVSLAPVIPVVAAGHAYLTKKIQAQATQQLQNEKVIERLTNRTKKLNIQDEARLHIAKQNAPMMSKSIRAWRTFRVGLLGAIAVGIIINEVINRIKKSLDAQIKTLTEYGNALHAAYKEMKNIAAIADAVGEPGEKLALMARAFVRDLALADVRKAVETYGDVDNVWKRMSKTMRQFTSKDAVKEMKDEFLELAIAIRNNEPIGYKYRNILNLIGNALGHQAKSYQMATEQALENAAISERHTSILRKTQFLMRDIPDLVSSINKHPITIAEDFDLDKLRGMSETLEELMSPDFDPMVADELKKMGDDYLKLLPILEEMKGKFDEALGKKVLMEREKAIEEYTRQFTQNLSKLAPSMEEIIRVSFAMARSWKMYLASGVGNVKQFVKDNREHLNILKLNWAKVPPAVKEVLQKVIDALDTTGNKMAQLKERARKGIKDWGETFQKLMNDITEMENKYRDDKNANIVLKAQEENMILLNNLNEQKTMYEQAFGANIYTYGVFTAMKLAMQKKLHTAEKLMRKENLDDLMKKQKDVMSNDLLTVNQRLKFARYMYDNFEEYTKDFGFTTEEELKKANKDWSTFWQNVIDNLNKVKTPMTSWIEGLRLMSQWLSSMVTMIRDWADALGLTGGIIDRVIGAMDTLSKGAANVSNSLKLIEWSKSDAADKAGGFMKSLAGIGGHIGAVVGIATTAIGVFKKLFGGKSEEEKARERAEREQKRMEAWIDSYVQTMTKYGDITDTTAKKIYELTQKGMPGFVAEAKELNAIMQDTGINMKNFSLYAARANDILHQTSDEWFTMEEAAAVFGEAFKKLLDYAQDAGIEGSKHLLDMIRKARELGYEVKEITEYINKELSKAAGGLFKMIEWVAGDAVDALSSIRELSDEEQALYEKLRKYQEQLKNLDEGSAAWLKMRDNIDVLMQKIKDEYPTLYEHIKTIERVANVTGGQLENLAVIAAGVFASMVESGIPVIEALNIMKDALGALRDRYEVLGEEVPEYLQPIFDMYDTMAKFPKKFAAFQGFLDVLSGVGNTAFLTAEMFDALMKEGKRYYSWLTQTKDKGGAGLPDEEAIRMIYPMLQQAWWYAEQYGFKLPKWMQEAIDTAKGFGLKFEKPAVDRQIDILKDLTYKHAPTLQKTTETGFRDVERAIDRLGTHGYQTGTPYIPYTHVAKIHAGEAVVPANLAGALREFFAGKVSGESFGGGGGVAQVNVHMDGSLIYKGLVPYLREGGEYSDFELSGDGVR